MKPTPEQIDAAMAAFNKTINEPIMDKCERCDGRGYHHGFGEDGADPDWCEICGGGGYNLRPGEEQRAMSDALSAALSVQPAAAVVGEPVAAYHVKVKGYGEELCFTEDGANSLVKRIRRTKGQDGEATITPLYATLPNEALERSEQATFDIAARLLKERDALATRISQQDAELDRLRRELEGLRQTVEFVVRQAWREDPPNANHKLTDSERLSAIKFYPTIKDRGRP